MTQGITQTCVITNEALDQDDMLKLVCDPMHRVVVDVYHKLPGEAIWIKGRKTILEQIINNKNSPFLKLQDCAMISPDIMEVVPRLLFKQCLELLRLIMKSGCLVMGFEKVHTAIASGEVACLVQASDGSVPERNKLTLKAGSIDVIALFSKAQLNQMLGRGGIIHVALKDHPLTQRFMKRATILESFVI